MPTLGGRLDNGQIIFGVAVQLPTRPDDEDEPMPQMFRGLLDTGAQRTMVSRHVVDALGASPCGTAEFMLATGQPERTDVYLLDLAIPVVTDVVPVDDDMGTLDVSMYVRGLANVPVRALPRAFSNFDVLLGMDLLSQFHITICHGLYMLSN